MSLMLGTVFFALLQNSIDNGFKSGMFISAGVIFSDIILITIAVFNATLIPPGGTTEMIVRICGGAFLLYYGLNNLLRTKPIEYPVTKSGRILIFFSRGFLLNFLNPGNFIGWLAVSVHITQVAHYSVPQTIAFYAGALSAIFGMEVLISFSASQLKRWITDRLLKTVNRVIGALFVGFSIFILWPVVKTWIFSRS
ncbi:MAG: LysE family transporter [Bacteroidota bacterium]